jgi:hypothetical protein
MTKGVSKKRQRDDQRRKRAAVAAGLAKGAKSPDRPIPVPTRPGLSRPPGRPGGAPA